MPLFPCPAERFLGDVAGIVQVRGEAIGHRDGAAEVRRIETIELVLGYRPSHMLYTRRPCHR
jgi:hypothetical protein